MELLVAIGHALVTAFDMFWEVLWPLVLGFGLSAIVRGGRRGLRPAECAARQIAARPSALQTCFAPETPLCLAEGLRV